MPTSSPRIATPVQDGLPAGSADCECWSLGSETPRTASTVARDFIRRQ